MWLRQQFHISYQSPNDNKCSVSTSCHRIIACWAKFWIWHIKPYNVVSWGGTYREKPCWVTGISGTRAEIRTDSVLPHVNWQVYSIFPILWKGIRRLGSNFQNSFTTKTLRIEKRAQWIWHVQVRSGVCSTPSCEFANLPNTCRLLKGCGFESRCSRIFFIWMLNWGIANGAKVGLVYYVWHIKTHRPIVHGLLGSSISAF